MERPPGKRGREWDGEGDGWAGDSESDAELPREKGADCGEKAKGKLRPPQKEKDSEELLREAERSHSTREGTEVEGRMVVWTDGAAAQRRDEQPVASGGVFYAEGDRRNRSVPVVGQQTSQRAELIAALSVLEEELGPLELRTDSTYLAAGLTCWSRRWVRRALYKSPAWARPISNADIWHRILQMISLRESAVKVRWVKAHPTRDDVEEGRTTMLDVWGNARADWWAKQGIEKARA